VLDCEARRRASSLRGAWEDGRDTRIVCQSEALRALSPRAKWIILTVTFVVIAGMVGLIVWAVSSTGGSSAPRPGFERFEPAWASAMSKASVEATFPAGPVDVTKVRVTGSQSFEATFTGEEMAALLSVYSYEARVSGQTFAIGNVGVEFPEPGVTSLRLTLYDPGIELQRPR
jgi:hypothetical protein